MENEKNTNDNTNTNDNSKAARKRKRKSPFLRILTLVVLLCVAVFGAIIISDLVEKNNTEDKAMEPAFITIKISGDFIYLDGDKVSLEELREYLDTEYEKDDFPVVSLINDTENPSDYGVYNKVADLLGNYGINIERMLPSTDDEISGYSTDDEV